MAPLTGNADEATHNALLDKLDIHAIPKPFRNPNWKPPQRRNKNIKQILAEASRKEASVLATQNNSGSSTPVVDPSAAGTTGATTPAFGAAGDRHTLNVAQAEQRLEKMVLERNLKAQTNGGGLPPGIGTPTITYSNIEAAPSLKPASKRRYCDVTGLPAPYTDPKTRLRYHDKEVFAVIRSLGQGATEGYLAARGAHTVLK